MIVVLTVVEDGETEVYRVPDDDGQEMCRALSHRLRDIAMGLMLQGRRSGVMLACAPDDETCPETIAKAVDTVPR